MPRAKEPARVAAEAVGAKRYVSARPCSRGHRERFIAGGGCYVCAMDRQRARAKPKLRQGQLPITVQLARKQNAIAAAAVRAQFTKTPRCPFRITLSRYNGSTEEHIHSQHCDHVLIETTERVLATIKKAISDASFPS